MRNLRATTRWGGWSIVVLAAMTVAGCKAAAPVADGDAGVPGMPPDVEAVAPADDNGAATSAEPVEGYTVSAMVGHVNGRPIYAREVLEEIDAPLRSLGKDVSGYAFERRATALIFAKLRQIVSDALILGRAEQSLTEMEREGLKRVVERQREELLRRYGQGAQRDAEIQILEQTGRTFDQAIEDYRIRVLIRAHVQREVMPDVHITRKAVERYYRDHFDEFNSPPGVKIHMIRTNDEGIAQSIDGRLVRGDPFLEVAGDANLNAFLPAVQGRYDTLIRGESGFGKEIDDAIESLAVGEHSVRITLGPNAYAWVYVASRGDGRRQELEDVQLMIRARLTAQRVRALTERYNEKLMREGSYTPFEEMTAAVLEVAMSRYGQFQ